MSVVLELTPHDPLIARDGRPFGAGQGNRMRGLPWPLPSVVAGSFRTALVKATGGEFTAELPKMVLERVQVAGLFPVHNKQLYLPAPLDCLGEPAKDKNGSPVIHRVRPVDITGGCDLPSGLQPVMLDLPDNAEDFKPATVPAWWPVEEYAQWLTRQTIKFDCSFLLEAKTEYRDHVKLDPHLGSAMEGQIFSTANLSVSHLPRYGVKLDDTKFSLDKRYAEITLATRVQVAAESLSKTAVNFWHPLGGERRPVHWQQCQQAVTGWSCPEPVKTALANATHIRLVLATPAIFTGGWKPGWLNQQLEGTPPGNDVKLKLVGACTGRWKAVSGWDLVKRGPKPIRRMVPAGSVYFFTCEKGAATQLADLWLQSISDDEQERRDGFGLALWGTW